MFEAQLYKSTIEQSFWFKLWSRPVRKIFESLVYFRTYLYQKGILKSHRLPGRCISIGNVAVGGTGKTPVVIALAQELKHAGFFPAIVTRGYRSGLLQNESALLIDQKIVARRNHNREFFADEAMMQSAKLLATPILVGAKRYDTVRWFLESFDYRPTHWLLDDGFQHLKIKRDIDIVLMDARDPYCNGLMLPQGVLREPLSSLLRSNFQLYTRSNALASKIEDKRMGSMEFAVPFKQEYFILNQKKGLLTQTSADYVMSRNAFLVSAIAKPRVLVESLKKEGFIIKSKLLYKDHERFSLEAIQEYIAHCDTLITTAKDYWREPKLFEKIQKKVVITDVLADLPTEFIQSIIRS